MEDVEYYLKRSLKNVRRLSPAFRKALYMDAAFYYAYYASDAQLAREYYEKGKNTKNGFINLRFEAAVLYAEGDTETCLSLASEAMTRLTEIGRSDIEAYEKNYLQNLIHRANEKINAESS
jgi:hypothetical protein